MNEIQFKQAEISKYANNKFKDEKEQARFRSNVISIVNSNSLLANADIRTVLSACYQGALLNLPMDKNFGYAYVVPYKGQAQFQMGYKGYVQLALRTGQYKQIEVSEVREGELIKNDRLKGVEFEWIQDDLEREKLPIIGYVAYFELTNGFNKMLYMTKQQMENHFMKYSQGYKKFQKFTQASYDDMAKKTVIKNLLAKWGIMSVEMQSANKIDQAVINEKDNEVVINYVDNEKDTEKETGYLERQKEGYKVEIGEVVQEEDISDFELTPEQQEIINRNQNDLTEEELD